MASLKEIKGRIASVNSTKKITSAMKMIASAKLHKAQATIVSFLPYTQKLNQILTCLLASDSNFDSAYAQEREVKRVAIVAFSSNSSLCGSFNANILKEFSQTYSQYENLGKENILVYPVGKKIMDFANKSNIKIEGQFTTMADKPSFQPVLELSNDLVSKFLNKEVDRIILVYTHFKSAGSQQVTNSVYLPFDLDSVREQDTQGGSNNVQTDYILEPTREELLSHLIPKVLASNLYSALLDSNASEHAARSMAMQIATDNAQDLVQDLTVEYNKSRQGAITNQLLDIIGGASAL